MRSTSLVLKAIANSQLHISQVIGGAGLDKLSCGCQILGEPAPTQRLPIAKQQRKNYKRQLCAIAFDTSETDLLAAALALSHLCFGKLLPCRGGFANYSGH